MFRQSMIRMCSAAEEMQKQKIGTLFKIISGEASFKNKAPVKDANITAVFGNEWRSELEAWFNKSYTAKMTPQDKAAAQARLDVCLRRLALTRYTSSELKEYFAEGAANVDRLAEADNIKQAAAFLKAKGGAAFDSHVAAEAKNANWTPAQTKAFVEKVKGA